jgi:ADP-ribose pyrophosphatase YjhB (NUDIX family)
MIILNVRKNRYLVKAGAKPTGWAAMDAQFDQTRGGSEDEYPGPRYADVEEALKREAEKTKAALDRLGGIVEAGAVFKFCPACGSPRLYSARGRMWVCPDCGFEYFHNVATASGILIEARGEVVLLKRAKEPSKGKFALPGGFVDPGERAEDAALRECREELGWSPSTIEFLATYPNVYKYHGIPYATCDLYFYAHAPMVRASDFDIDPEEVSEVAFVRADAISWGDIAFESTARALRKFILAFSIGNPPRSAEWEGIE